MSDQELLQPQESVVDRDRVLDPPRLAPDAETVLEQIRDRRIATVIVGGCDINGIFRAKRVPAERFASSPEPSVDFSEYMWAMDIEEYAQPRPDGFEGWWPTWATGFGDIAAVADLATLRTVPWLDRTAVVLCNYRFPDGRPYEVAPRNVLNRVLERYERLGLEPRISPEYEFFVFRETEQSAFAKGFRDLEPLSPQAMAYGALRATVDDHLIGRIADALASMRIPIEAWNPEGGAGQYELNLPHSSGLEAADRGFLFKQGVKELCALNGLLATFVPKLAAGGFGSSLHVHQSVWREGKPAFSDEDRPDGMSKLMKHFVAGQLRTLTPFSAIWLPTPLSFKRGQAYFAAGTTESWGGDNKTLSLRVVAYEPDQCRVEHRVPGADANVYLTLAAMLAGGLYGIENELELPPATDGDAYSMSELKQLPRTLDAAIGAFEESDVAKEYLGDEFVRRYAASRRWELERSQEEVTDWELKRYFVRG